MNRIFIIIGFPLAMLLSSCSTYKAVLYPCDFTKYRSFRPECVEHKNIRYKGGDFNSSENKEWLTAESSSGYVMNGAIRGAQYCGLTWNPPKSNQDDKLILTCDNTDGFIFPPHLGRHWIYSWDFPPKTATIIATDSVTGNKLFEIYYSRYMISMASEEFHGYIQGAVEYCIKELRKSPPKDAPLEITIPPSILSEAGGRYCGRNRSALSKTPETQKSDSEK